MKAIIVREFGSPEVLRIDDVFDPVPGAGQVVVRNHAVGVNPVDAYVRTGTYANKPQLPYTPGMDAAGVVEAVGEGVKDIAIGARVFTAGLTKSAYAEKMLLQAEQVRPLPDNVTFAQGAAMNVPYATAYRSLIQRGRGKSGEVVMVHGGSGGVGIAAIQIAKAHGLTVIATAGTREGLKLIESQGAKYVLNHREPGYVSDALGATCGHGADIILEMLANVNLGTDLTLLAPQGRIVIIGSRGEVTINPRDAMSRDADILGMTLFNTPPEAMQEIYDYLAAGLADGSLNPVVGQEFPLAEAARAHEAVMESGSRGKIVLIP